MLIRNLLTLLLITFILAGCAETSPIYSIGKGRNAYVESDLIGTYEGIGLLKSSSGQIKQTFRTTLSGYKENNVVFLNEKYYFDNGHVENYTYRITPTEFSFDYDCVRIETLDKCKVERAGGTIILDITSEKTTMNEIKVTNAKQSFHFLDSDRMIKHTYYNKFLMVHDMDEIIHYTRVSQ